MEKCKYYSEQTKKLEMKCEMDGKEVECPEKFKNSTITKIQCMKNGGEICLCGGDPEKCKFKGEKERHIIVKNKDDLNDNVKQLSDDELQEQVDNVWYIIQYTVGLNDAMDNNELCEYCSHKFSDILDYMLKLNIELMKRNLKPKTKFDLNDAKVLMERICDSKSKILGFFSDGSPIDWDHVATL